MSWNIDFGNSRQGWTIRRRRYGNALRSARHIKNKYAGLQMKLVTVSIIRNEADILETFIRYHCQIVDHMIVINHRSTDASPRILQLLKKEGLNLKLADNTALEQPQRSALTCAMRKAVRELGADWVLPLDADEFVGTQDEGTVRENIGSFPCDQVIRIPWRTYVPMPSDDLQEHNILKRITHQRSAEPRRFFKVLVPAVLAGMRGVALGFGSHKISGRAFFRRKDLPSVETNRLVLAHFPVRSGDQITTKAITGWLACLARKDRSRNDNLHLKGIYDRYREGHPISREELTAMALAYAADRRPVQPDVALNPVRPEGGDFVLRYGAESQCNPLAALAQIGEEFAQAFGSIRRKHFLVSKPLSKDDP